MYVRNEIRDRGSLPPDFMTEGLFFELIKQKCSWCHKTPEESNGGGVDRRDNDLGHIEGNVESCCGRCNKRRGKDTWEVFGAYLLDMGLLYGRQEETYE